MTQKGGTGKPLGRTTGSLNAPIAAFTMAIILCSYCISSINSARREAQSSPVTATTRAQKFSVEKSDQSWVQQALETRDAEQQNRSR
ncbi:hypothetical protein V6Z96_006427 [Aspergillus fumigatus]